MKKNKKKKIDIAKNISSLKKDLLDSQNNQNNLKLNNKIQQINNYYHLRKSFN